MQSRGFHYDSRFLVFNAEWTTAEDHPFYSREQELIARDVSRKHKVTLRSVEGRVHFALGVWQTAREAESSQEKSAKGAPWAKRKYVGRRRTIELENSLRSTATEVLSDAGILSSKTRRRVTLSATAQLPIPTVFRILIKFNSNMISIPFLRLRCEWRTL